MFRQCAPRSFYDVRGYQPTITKPVASAKDEVYGKPIDFADRPLVSGGIFFLADSPLARELTCTTVARRQKRIQLFCHHE